MSLVSPITVVRRAKPSGIGLLVIIATILLAIPLAYAAKGGDPGKPGSGSGTNTKTPGPTATVSGTVSNSYTGFGIAGAEITFATLTASFTATTDGSGVYTIKVPANAYYDVSFSATNYDSQTVAGSLIKGKNNTLDATLMPVARVIVTASVSGTSAPGATLTATGSYLIMDGSTLESAEWVQSEGTPAAISDPTALVTDVQVAGLAAYKAELLERLENPPITEDQLPPNVPPTGEYFGGLQDRDQVVGINHLALERAEELPLAFEVTTSSGTYSAAADLTVALPWHVNPGLKTVPINSAALLLGKEDAAYAWVIQERPNGSSAELNDADSRSPWFVPDADGTYKIVNNVSGAEISVHAGLWHGVIDPTLTFDSVMYGDGRPEGDENCVGCHTDKFEEWRQTGHAEIFTQNINSGPGGHYGPSCFGCHTVGFNPDVDSLGTGFDDKFNYLTFIASGLLNSSTEAWTMMLDNSPGNEFYFPDLVRVANVQCESCHGPQDYTEAHRNQPGSPRVSLSADVCASCHGEPLRHARFQQWQLSKHADYELARDEGESGNCSRCHSANGFIAWTEAGNDPDQNVTVTWDADSVHPQTCVACHDPHHTGTTSGSAETNAHVRIEGNTAVLVAGFQALGVGKGAVCMTCHNSRRGLRNDSNWDTTTDKDRAPHPPTQADLVMGENAYFVTVGEPGKHAIVEDTCVNCHMEKTPPPDLLAYNQGGTNHTFFASEDVCSRCHGEGFTADGVQEATAARLAQLESLIEAKYVSMMQDLVDGGASIDLNGATTITSAAQIEGVTLSESRGRQSIDVKVAGIDDPITVNLGNVDIIGGPSGGQTLYDVSDVLMKATWNYHLVGNDGGLGVHNQAFSTAALNGAINAVNAM